MFQISDDDLLWDEDFQVEDTVAEVTNCTFGIKPLLVESLPARGLEQDDIALESSKCETNISAKPSTLQSQLSANNHSKQYNQDGKTVSITENLPKLCKRKFPGPAGILPPYSPSFVLESRLPDSPDVAPQPKSPNLGDLKEKSHQLSWSQVSSDDVFKSPQWKALVSDLGTDSESLIAKFSIKSALLKASRKLLHRGKIPLIIGVIDILEMQGSDASIVIRDPSGKMNGALHSDLFKDQSTALQIGSVLVLRQVSVISPSSRTHYLNITPGNVVLVYTANKEAEVAIQLYHESHKFSNGMEVETNDSKTQFLYEIIKTSEQELSEALKNSCQGSKTHMSPSLGNEHQLNNGLNSRYLSSVTPRGPLVLQRNQNNVTPAGRSSSSLFNCSPHSLTNVTHGRIVTPHSSVNTAGNVNLTVPKQIMSSPAQMLGSNSLMRHVTNVKHCSSTRADGMSSPAFQQSRLELINSNMSSNQLQVNSVERSRISSCLNPRIDKDVTYDNTSHVKTCRTNIPHADDKTLPPFCGDVFSQNQDANYSRNMVDFGLNPHGKFNVGEGIMRTDSTCGNIINEVFSDCRKENQRINTSFKKENIYKGNSYLSHPGGQFTSAGRDLKMDTNMASGTTNNSAAVLQTGDVTKKFSFKRSLPASDVSQVTTLMKRSTCDVVHQNTETTEGNALIHSSSLSAVSYNVKNCDNLSASLRPCAPVAEHSKSTVTRADHFVPSVKPTMVQQAVHSSVFSNSINLRQAVCSESVADSSGSSRRDSGMPLLTGNMDSDKQTGHSSVFPSWDFDLSDEMLLSQLSEEF